MSCKPTEWLNPSGEQADRQRLQQKRARRVYGLAHTLTTHLSPAEKRNRRKPSSASQVFNLEYCRKVSSQWTFSYRYDAHI